MWMQRVFEYKGDKVDGFFFHPDRPWIFAGDNSGLIKIWDYNTQALIRQLAAHNGSVKSVHLHASRQILVSGGTDGKIVVWSYDESSGSGTSSFTLQGHESTVNSVQFHHEFPLIVSSSDDCTVRVWNWLSRNCITMLTHHSQSVTTASFHPREALILSASLDGDLCIWDASDIIDSSFIRMDSVQKSEKRNSICAWFMKRKNDARLKGVLSPNYWEKTYGLFDAIFHPTLSFIFTISEDRRVFMWDIKDSYSNAHRTLISGTTRVSRLAYSAKLKAIMIVLDGQNISLYNASSGERGYLMMLDQTHSHSSNIGPHPSKNLVAVNHADGFTVCRIRMGRRFDANNEYIYYVADNFLYFYDYKVKKESRVILPIEDPDKASFKSSVLSLSFSSHRNAILICLDNNGFKNDATYRLLLLSKDNEYSAAKTVREAQVQGYGYFAVFVGPDKFLVVRDHCERLWVKNLENEILSEIVLPWGISKFYSNCHEQFIYGFDCKVLMFDIHKEKVVGRIRLGLLKHASWASDSENVALLVESAVCIADKTFSHYYTVEEESDKIESGAWDDEHHVFIYKTSNHMKYCLTNGDTGILMSYNSPLYITKVWGDAVYCLDNEGELLELHIDASEYILKSSVLRKDYMKQCSSLSYGQVTVNSLIQGTSSIMKSSVLRKDYMDQCSSLSYGQVTVNSLIQGTSSLSSMAYNSSRVGISE